MKRLPTLLALTGAVLLAVLGGRAIVAQDSGAAKYTLKVPDGLPFSEFRGYESWQVVAISQTAELLKMIVANPVMIDAYRAGIPGNGKPFPDGSKIAKIEWTPKKSTEAPFDVNIPNTLKDVFFIERDSKRFADSVGWGYAQFNYDAASDKFTPDGSGSNCGAACHTIVKAKDYIFTAYGRR
jgi:Cytochrome P460